jgi:N-carbamoyl-L-amino-acid hydrolase
LALEEVLARGFAELAPIGAARDGAGYERFALTAVDRELRAWFARRARALGLRYERDRNANQWAWWDPPGRVAEGHPPAPGTGAPGTRAAGTGAPPDAFVAAGSHLDSVPGGGAFDGPLGVIGGFAAVEMLQARYRGPVRPVAVVNFADEEGARFGVSCVGSRLLTGALDPGAARALTDAEGTSLADALAAEGVDPAGIGRDDERLGHLAAFVELHIEQGRGLGDLAAPVGVASAIWPHGRWRLSFEGMADHAGTTRLDDRRDPLLVAATAVVAARAVAARSGCLATVGRVRVVPNGTNAIASVVEAWLDCRAPAESTVRAAVDEIADAAGAEARREGVELVVREESFTPEARFDPALRARIVDVLGGVPALATGAGHDAGMLSAVVPAAMLFVRNPTGVSHNPAEHAALGDCVAGLRALAAVLEDLACRG